MDILVPFFILGVVGVLTSLLCASRAPEQEREWVTLVLLVALAMRFVFAALFASVPAARLFHEDATGYESVGMRIASGWSGDGPPVGLMETGAQNLGYFYVCGAIYYVFGHARIAASLVNAILGTTTAFLVYRLSRQFFHVLVARRAMLLVAFVPSMVLWNSVALKDTPMTFLIVVSLSGCVALKRGISVTAVAATVLPVIAVQPIRFYVVYFLALAILVSLFIERGAQAIAGISKQMVIVAFFVVLLAIVGFSGRATEGMEVMDFQRVSSFRQGMASTADSGFMTDVDISTPGRALAFLPIGTAFLLLSPFPWQFTSLRASFAAPEMLLWWFLVPSLVRGVRFTVKTRFAKASPILLFALTLTGAYSLVHGNVGSGFRQRAQIFVFLFIFTSVGQYVKRCQRQGIDPNALLADSSVAAPPPPPEAATDPTPAAAASPD